MGANTSTDFRVEVGSWLREDIRLDDEDRWKMVFLTHMEPHEVAMYLPAKEIRWMRLRRPANLTRILYKCIEQLRFVAAGAPAFDSYGKFTEQRDGATGAAVGDSGKKKTTWTGKPVLDFTSAKNAIRIIAVVIPVLFEPLDRDVKREKTSDELLDARVAKARGQSMPDDPPESPFAENLADYFLWQNLECDGLEIDGKSKKFDLSLQEGDHELPFGEELMKLLSQLMFTPNFTVAASQRFIGEGTLSSNTPAEKATQESRDFWKKSLNVHPELLWFQGMAVPAKIPTVSSDIRKHRIEMMRCLMSCLTQPLFNAEGTRGILSCNKMLEVVVDIEKCPLTPTLCQSLMNCVQAHNSKGLVPYSSHYFAEEAEHCLALSMQLLSLLFTPPTESTTGRLQSGIARADESAAPSPARYVDPTVIIPGQTSSTTSTTTGEQSSPTTNVDHTPAQLGNSPFQYLHSLISLPHFQPALTHSIRSIFKVIGNPLYATTTWFNGSQKVVHCYQEALILLDRLLVVEKIRDVLTELTQEVITPLLYFAQEARVEYQFFGATQAATMALLTLSSQPRFAYLCHGANCKPFLPILPTLKGGTIGDVIVLMVCSTISPSSPRYMSCFYETYSTVLCNLLPQLQQLHETTAFELHHLLDFVTTEKFLRRGEVYQRTCSLIVEAVIAFIVHQPEASKSFFAALGVGEVPTRLTSLVSRANGGDRGPENSAEAYDPREDPLVVDDNSTRDNSFNDDPLEKEDPSQVRNPPRFNNDRREENATRARGTLSLNPALLPTKAQTTMLELLQSRAAAAVQSVKSKGQQGLVEMGSLKLSDEMLQVEKVLRKYDITQQENMRWLQSYLWGMIYRHNTNPPLFDVTKVTTFDLKK